MADHTVTDYYGTEFEVDPALKSSGPFVYMDREPARDFGGPTMDRLTPEEARNLAKQLEAAADAAEGQPPSPDEISGGGHPNDRG